MNALLLMILTFSLPAFAGVTAFSGDAGEKMFLESAPALGKDMHLVKVEGINSDWAGKVIKVKKESRSNGDRYSFDYKLELSSGVQDKTYNMITSVGSDLKEGSRVSVVEIFYNGMSDKRKGHRLHQDRKLTEASQKIDLAGQYKKSPYAPDPE